MCVCVCVCHSSLVARRIDIAHPLCKLIDLLYYYLVGREKEREREREREREKERERSRINSEKKERHS